MKGIKRAVVCFLLAIAITVNPISNTKKVYAIGPEIILASPEGMAILLLLVACGVVLSPGNTEAMFKGAVQAINATGETLSKLADGTVILTRKIRDAILDYVRSIKASPVVDLPSVSSITLPSLNTGIIDTGITVLGLGTYVVTISDTTGNLAPVAFYKYKDANNFESGSYVIGYKVFNTMQNVLTNTKFIINATSNKITITSPGAHLWSSSIPVDDTISTSFVGTTTELSTIKIRNQTGAVVSNVSITVTPRVDYTGDLTNVPSDASQVEYKVPALGGTGNVQVLPKTLNPTDVIGKTYVDTGTLADVKAEPTDVPVENATPTDWSVPDTAQLNFAPLQIPFADKFPFCIPFDLINSFKSFASERQTPKFEVNFPNTKFVGGGSFTLDFTQFDKIATILRYFILIIFIVNLIKLTRGIIKG